MINRIRSAVNFIANNQVQGNITPTEFNIALNNAIMSIYDGYFSELNRMLIMETKGQIFNGLADAPAKVRECIQYYLTKEEVSVLTSRDSVRFVLPDNCRFIDTILINKSSVSADIIDNAAQFEMIKGHKHTKPTLRYPIGLRVGSSFELAPNTITHVTLYYLRNPKHPNWTSNELGMFNPSDPMFEDVDMHVSEESRLIIGVLVQFGINLKDMELLQAAQLYAQQETQKNIIT